MPAGSLPEGAVRDKLRATVPLWVVDPEDKASESDWPNARVAEHKRLIKSAVSLLALFSDIVIERHCSSLWLFRE
jgi:hypothetical protein